MSLITLQSLFQRGSPDAERPPPRPAHLRQAARAIMPCRTAILGGHGQACPDGHVSRIWDNSCRPRSCPHGTFRESERWLATPRARLLACDHSPAILPLPPDLNPVWLAHVPLLTPL